MRAHYKKTRKQLRRENTTTRRKGGKKTLRNTHNIASSLAPFQKEITLKFFEMLLLIKLFHWKTHRYSTHKATDKLYEELNEHMDRFMEVLLGKSGVRMNFQDVKTVPLVDLDSQEKLENRINTFKGYLVNLTENKYMKRMSNTDLLNIRDEILADMNQFLYLLSLK